MAGGIPDRRSRWARHAPLRSYWMKSACVAPLESTSTSRPPSKLYVAVRSRAARYAVSWSITDCSHAMRDAASGPIVSVVDVLWYGRETVLQPPDAVTCPSALNIAVGCVPLITDCTALRPLL